MTLRVRALSGPAERARTTAEAALSKRQSVPFDEIRASTGLPLAHGARAERPQEKETGPRMSPVARASTPLGKTAERQRAESVREQGPDPRWRDASWGIKMLSGRRGNSTAGSNPAPLRSFSMPQLASRRRESAPDGR